MDVEPHRKLNCWEFMNCGREKGGLMVDHLGECPVCSSMKYDGLNDGRGAGRACWMVGSTGCTGHHNRLKGPRRCLECEFYKRVLFEQEKKTCFRFSVETA